MIKKIQLYIPNPNGVDGTGVDLSFIIKISLINIIADILYNE